MIDDVLSKQEERLQMKAEKRAEAVIARYRDHEPQKARSKVLKTFSLDRENADELRFIALCKGWAVAHLFDELIAAVLEEFREEPALKDDLERYYKRWGRPQ